MTHNPPRPSVPSVTITLKPPKSRPFASAPIPMANACPDYPNGFIYCHQCSKKRDITDAIQCTFLELHTSTKEKEKDKDKDKEKPPRQRRCVGKFCKFCLKNRYDQEFEDVVNIARSKKKEPGHVESAGYIFKCPKCSDACNCPRCRKTKGLEPMGSAGTIRRPPPKPVPKAPSISERNKAERKSKTKDPSSTGKAKSASAAKKAKPKPLPIVKWTPIPVNLSLEDAELRFNIREFILRFADLMEPTIPKANLEELEEIGGRRYQGRDEDEEMTGWVSEFCVKSIIIGLLNLLAKELTGTLATAIRSAVKEIRNMGVNLNKIWPILAPLRDVSIAEDLAAGLPKPVLSGSATPFRFTFPDPLPPPALHDIRAMRSTRNIDSDGLHIAYSAQMIPVISALIEDALLTTAVREEIESGVREGKEVVKDAREAVKREAERWEQVRKTMESHVKVKAQILENRAKREYHKHKLISLDNALKVVMPKFAPRLTHFGTDTDERVYWILSPGAQEREAAHDFILACASDGERQKRGKKRAKVLSSGEERAEMRQWSWLIAVWGKRPGDAAGYDKSKAAAKVMKDKRKAEDETMSGAEERSDAEEADSDSSEEEDKERWWGIYEPHEVLKLAEWITMKAGLNGDATKATSSIQHDKDEQGSRASSSTLTLNGSISTPGIRSASHAGGDGSNGTGKSRDTSVTVVGGPESSGKNHLQNLVDELKTFAGLLEWRVREDKYDLVMRDVSAASGGGKGKGRESTGGAVSASSFYGTR